MATVAPVPAPKYIYVGHVQTYLEDLFRRDKKGLYNGFQAKIEAAAIDPSSYEGTITYKNHRFYEWKSGRTNRIFGFVKDDTLYICLAAIDHKNKKYIGATWDGEDEFSATFNNRPMKATDLNDAVRAVLG